MKHIGKILLAALVLAAAFDAGAQNRAEMLRDSLVSGKKYCIVAAHRGDWRNAPENSLQAMENCIRMGADMVELDIKMTKDSTLVLMHDWDMDRTTTFSGPVSKYTLKEIKEGCFLKSGHGMPSTHRVPTLEEVLIACKGQILINIDQGYDWFPQVVKLLEKTGTMQQVVIKSGNSLAKLQKDNPELLGKVIYMPVISLESDGAEKMIDEYSEVHPAAIECNFSHNTPQVERLLRKIQSCGIKIWINALWPSLNAGHYDDMAVEEGRYEESWGWILNEGASIIQTDRPKELLEYLRLHQRH